MSNDRYTVISAIAGKEKTTFYTIGGKIVSVNANDPSLPSLLEKCQPYFARKQPVEIDLGSYSIYEEFEKKTNGLVRFFRAAKAKVQSVFESLTGQDHDEPEEKELDQQTEVALETVVTEVMVEQPVAPVAPPVPQTKIRYDDVKQDLKPVKEDEPLKDDETVVAVLGNVVIPNAQQLKPYIAHALKHNSEKAVIAFLERIARVIDQRGHSIPDLFNFLEKGDLPLSEDGCIIAYKILRKSSAHPGFTYVDCHSGNVHQRVGTFVRVEEKLVDKNRHNECSNGLHVARRGYIGQFGGDVCTMIKVAPEDVIAVPHEDYNKVRVCGYHIIFELPDHVYNVLRSNRPTTSDPEAAAMLAKAISGEHIAVLEEVWIGGQKGSNLSVKNRVEGDVERQEKKKARITEGTEAPSGASALDDPTKSVMDVKKVQKDVKAAEAKVAAEMTMPILERYKIILDTKDVAGAQELLDRKKKAKKSWNALGLPDDAGTKLQDVVSGFAAAISDPTPVIETKAEPKKEDPQRANEFFDTKKASKTKAVKAKPEQPKVEEPKEEANKSALTEQAIHYLNGDWVLLWELKRRKKKSWFVLGFGPQEIETIKKNKR